MCSVVSIEGEYDGKYESGSSYLAMNTRTKGKKIGWGNTLDPAN
jgi:hypothetical protein